MGKKLPIVRRLEVALAETSSQSEVNMVYGLLGSFCSGIDCDLTQDDFYLSINHKTFSVLSNYDVKLNKNKIQRGKEVASLLKGRVVLPSRGEARYREKMVYAMKEEFKLLTSRYCEG